jgi:hypothetical protein
VVTIKYGFVELLFIVLVKIYLLKSHVSALETYSHSHENSRFEVFAFHRE